MRTLILATISIAFTYGADKPEATVEGKLTPIQLSDLRRQKSQEAEIRTRAQLIQVQLESEMTALAKEHDAVTTEACLAIGVPADKIATECRVQFETCNPAQPTQCTQMVDEKGKPTGKVWWEKPKQAAAAKPAQTGEAGK